MALDPTEYRVQQFCESLKIVKEHFGPTGQTPQSWSQMFWSDPSEIVRSIQKVETVPMLSCQFNIGPTATWITRIVKQFAFLLWTSAKLLTL